MTAPVFLAVLLAACIPWILGGVALHLGYQLFLVAGYRAGDLTLVYPIARGSAPLIVTLVSIGVMGVSFTVPELSGVALIALGLVSLALVRRGDGARNPRAVGMALCTGGFIAAYSLVDGIGARVALTALGYWTWSAIGNAMALTLWTALTRPGTFRVLLSDRAVARSGLIGGGASFLAYYRAGDGIARDLDRLCPVDRRRRVERAAGPRQARIDLRDDFRRGAAARIAALKGALAQRSEAERGPLPASLYQPSALRSMFSATSVRNTANTRFSGLGSIAWARCAP